MNEKLEIEAIILDWAGTTIDYGCMAPVHAFIAAFNQYEIFPTIEEVRKPMGLLKIDHIRSMLSMTRLNDAWLKKYRRNWDENDVKSIYKRMEEITLESLVNFVDIKPNVTEVVAELRKNGIKIGSTTGYTDEMMNIVAPIAKKNGYEPDAWVSPNSTNNIGRPFPYMIFKNMEMLGVSSVKKVIKVGDTIADINEGKNAGVITIGIIEGSSVMGYSRKEYEALSESEKMKEMQRVKKVYVEAGADFVVEDISGILNIISM